MDINKILINIANVIHVFQYTQIEEANEQPGNFMKTRNIYLHEH